MCVCVCVCVCVCDVEANRLLVTWFLNNLLELNHLQKWFHVFLSNINNSIWY